MLHVVSIRSRQLDIETGTFKPAAEQRSELSLRRGFCGFGSGWLDWQISLGTRQPNTGSAGAFAPGIGELVQDETTFREEAKDHG